MVNFKVTWNRMSGRMRIFTIILALVLIGLSTRSIILTILAWIIIIYVIVKVVMDYELFD